MQGNLNENIRRLRMQYGVNQVEFAKKMNVTKLCGSNWENANVLPSIEMLVKMAEIFSVSTDYLLGRTAEDSIDTEGLTEEQSSHVRKLGADLRKANENK